MSTPNPSSSEPTPPPLTELAALAHWLSVPDNEVEPSVEPPPPPASGLAALAALLESEPDHESDPDNAEPAGRPAYFWPAELMGDREAEPDAATDTLSMSPIFGSAPEIERAPETSAVETPWASLEFPDLITEAAGEPSTTAPLNLADKPVSSATIDANGMGWEPQIPRPAGPVTEAIATLTQAVLDGNSGDVKGCLETIGRQYSASEAIRIFLAASRGVIG